MRASACALVAMLMYGCVDPARADPTVLTTVGERVPYDFAVLIPQLPPLRLGESGTIGVRASDCGSCHQDNYREWRESTHAHAMRDPQYFAELSKPSSPRWLCLNCHAPVQNQRRIVIDADTQLRADPHDVSEILEVPNPDFDRAMQREGVTCAACHVRVANGASYVVAPAVSGRAPHPVRAAPTDLASICQRCHSPGHGALTATFSCWFETADEGRAHGVKDACIECHMPSVVRPLVPGGRPKKNRHHTWAGGGVPKTFRAYDSLLARNYETGLKLTAKIVGDALEIEAKNLRAGHHLTSADPERFILVRTEVVDRSGTRRLNARRFGQTWDWGSTNPVRYARRTGDTRLPVGASVKWRVSLPDGFDEIRVRAAHVRLHPANARHMKESGVRRELLDIWPEAADQVRDLEAHYPFLSWIARLTYRDGGWKQATPETLIEESKAMRGTSLHEYESLLEVPLHHDERSR